MGIQGLLKVRHKAAGEAMLVAVLSGLLPSLGPDHHCDCRSARDLERFARRHRQAFNQVLGLDLSGAPCDSTFLYLFERVDLDDLFGMLRQWMDRMAPRGSSPK